MKPEPDLGQGAPFLALTPPGALYAFGCPKPDDGQTELQTLLAQPALPRWADWCDQAPHRAGLLTRALAEGWVQTLERGLSAPKVRLDDFLSHVIGSLSGLRKAALACGGGFCVGHTGYTPHEAETLCAAAADFSEFGRRQQQRGWQGASHMDLGGGGEGLQAFFKSGFPFGGGGGQSGHLDSNVYPAREPREAEFSAKGVEFQS